MKKEKKTLSARVLATAVALNTSGCAGLDLHLDVLGQVSRTKESGKRITKVGGMFSQGVVDGSYRLGIGIRYAKLPGGSSSEEHDLKVGNFIDTTIKEKSGEKDSIDFFFLAEKKVWSVKPKSWYQFAVLLGGGMQINMLSSSSLVKIGDSDPTVVPDIKPINSIRGFVNNKLEVVLGPDYFSIPIQFDTRIYLEKSKSFSDSVDSSISVGYRINWGSFKKKVKDTCKYMPDRKVIPLRSRLEVYNEKSRKGDCRTDYHEGGGNKARHIELKLYSCEGKGCTEKYRQLVDNEISDKNYKRLVTSPECFAVQREFDGTKEQSLYCNLVKTVYRETVTYKQGNNSDLAKIVGNVARKVLKDLRK